MNRLQRDSEYKCYGQCCAELEACLCKRLYPFLHKMERALGVWLEVGDGGWHNSIQGGVYGVTEDGKAIYDYLFLHSVFSPLLLHALNVFRLP
jgi:hypothetical protein